MNRRIIFLGGLQATRIAQLLVLGWIGVSLSATQPGSLDPTFTFTIPQGRIQAISPLSDGRLLLGGYLSGQTSCRGLFVPAYEDGSVDLSFLEKSVPDGGGNCGAVRTIALQPDGKMLVGGYFATYSGLNRLRIARVNPDGSPD